MTRDRSSSGPTHPAITAPRVDPELARIVERAAPGALIIRAKALGTDETSEQQQTTAKAAGYGIPIRIDVEVHGQARSFVLHGSSANQFGHDRRADRAAELLLAADTYGRIPQHVRALEVGAFRPDGSSVSLSHTREFYLLTEYAEGRPYAEDLRRIAETQTLTEQDSSRLVTLVDYRPPYIPSASRGTKPMRARCEICSAPARASSASWTPTRRPLRAPRRTACSS